MTVILYTKRAWTSGPLHGDGTIEIFQCLLSDITIDNRGCLELIQFGHDQPFRPVTDFAKIEIIP